MKKVANLMLLTWIVLLSVAGCSREHRSSEPVSSITGIPFSTQISGETDGRAETETIEMQDNPITQDSNGLIKETQRMLITIGGFNFTVTLENNSSAEALKEYLAGGPVTLSLEDYAGMEIVGDLGTTLPRNDKQIDTTKGDVILYLGNQFAIYYGENS